MLVVWFDEPECLRCYCIMDISVFAVDEPKLCRVAPYQELYYTFEGFFAGLCCCRQALKNIFIVVLEKMNPCFLFLLVQIIDESVSLSVSNLLRKLRIRMFSPCLLAILTASLLPAFFESPSSCCIFQISTVCTHGASCLPR